MALASGTRLGPYEVLSQIGAGGMGEVYLAQDARLKRKLALKLLPAEFTSDQVRVRRFEQEARAASALNHPNIITIHEIGEAEGRRFIATEFVEGQTLRRRMRQPLSILESIETAVQIASALSAAHGAGIIHRDIKPENVMMRPDGLVKVLDFGLAKLAPPKPQIPNSHASTFPLMDTEPGIVMGTAAYMSPEQARGREIDARSDIFSLGVSLYEMVGGHLPFEGLTANDLIASILKSEPLPLPDSVPEELQRIITKALCKDRESRYQVISDLLLDLEELKRRLAFEAELGRRAQPHAEISNQITRPGPTVAASNAETIISRLARHKLALLIVLLFSAAVALSLGSYLYAGHSEAAIDSIAVLPFTDGTGDRVPEYLSDGITEQLINSLAQLPQLRVPARATMFRYKSQDVDPQKVGRELGVRAVLMGRVAARENALSIQVDLVSVARGAQLWGQQYTRKLADVQVAPEDIARDVVARLKLALTNEQQQQMAKHGTQDSEAYDLYMKGRYHTEKRTEEGIKRAIDFFQQALARDPGYALAYAGLADCYILGGNALPWQETEVRLKAKDAARESLARDETLVEAHTSLAVVSMLYDWNWAAAEREFKRAIELNPSYVRAHHWYAEYLTAMGRQDEALNEITRAQELDPLSVIITRDVGMHYYYAGRYDKAIEQARKTLELDSEFSQAHRLLGLSYLKTGKITEAITELLGVVAHSGSGRDRATLAHAYAIGGNRAEARRILNDLFREDSVPPYHIAVVYAGLGDEQRAFDLLERAYREQASMLAYLKIDPRLENLRSHPHFRDLARRVGLPE